MKVQFFTVLVAISMFFSNSCNSLKEIVSAEKPTLSISDFKVDQITLSDINLLFDIEVKNPNPLSLTINKYDYSFLIGGQNFVSGTQNMQTQVPASSANNIQIPVSFGYQDLFDTFQTLRDQEETDFTFEGMVSINVPILGLIEIPYSQSGTLPVVKRPNIRIRSMKVRSMSLSKIALDFNFEIENPNGFAVNLSDFSYDLAINNLDAINGSITDKVDISSKSTNSVTIPIELNVLQAGMGIYKAISDREPLDFSFTGNTTLGTDLPYFKGSTFNFDRSGSVDLPK